jgi:hypothetical protein
MDAKPFLPLAVVKSLNGDGKVLEPYLAIS